ncbi:hypothetical protein DVQ80_01625 [Yersinia enterocolitica]|nr:hypothetical protein [Yersinia enterocolitica]
MNNIEELKKVALAATPGPWEKCDSYGPNENGTCISAVERPDLMIASTTGYYGRVGGIANTHFIALANPAVILDLIAQLESAQKERDALREVHIGAGSNTRAAADIYFQLVEELEVPAGGSLVGVIDNLKAELSAANEKLKGEQVPVGFTSERALAEVYCGESSRFGPLDDVGDIPLYDRPLKPVVLSSSTVMSRAYVVRTIKAAGFTVEGE